MDNVRTNIVSWLSQLPYWGQKAAEKIIKQEPISDSTVSELIGYMKSANEQPNLVPVDFSFFLQHQSARYEIELKSVGSIAGIDALSPRTPLEFPSGLSVVYGNNGSGKTGYTRILKKACGKLNSEHLKPNVYAAAPAESRCTIVFRENGVEIPIVWLANSSPISQLMSVDIFDSKSGYFYLEGETEVTYAPIEVALFEQLVNVYTSVKEKLEAERNGFVSKLPAKPSEYAGSTLVNAIYGRMKANSDVDVIKRAITYTQLDSAHKASLEERLKSDPSALATVKRQRASQIVKIKRAILTRVEKLAQNACNEFHVAKEIATAKRKIAQDAANNIAGEIVLDGFGSDTWKTMWAAAKEYSQNYGYVDLPFPVVSDDAHCVLCQQPLAEDAKKRLENFESFILGKIESDANQAEAKLKLLLENLPAVHDKDALVTTLQAAQLDESLWLSVFEAELNKINDFVVSLKEFNEDSKTGYFLDKDYFVELDKLIDQLNNDVIQHERDAANFDKVKIEHELLENKAKFWAFGYLDSIISEIDRLKSVEKLDSLLGSLRTNNISIKAGEVSQSVITDAYIQRFNAELIALGANQIRVALVKSRVAQGRVKHKVQLRGLNTAYRINNTTSVLSEGEQRVVTLAAFLADVTSKPNKAPFIFDDPISSLDQIYEEKTAQRLIELSKTRQVIVFTHRLSLLGLLSDSGNCTHIRRESWGCGEHGNIPIFAKKPLQSLKDIKNARLPQSAKILNDEGYEAYYPLAKSICSDIRILIERIVEIELLGDVIQRHRRQVHTLKLKGIVKVNTSDCEYIENLMTEFSTYEHSQSLEAPVQLPDANFLIASVDALIDWLEKFKVRSDAGAVSSIP